MSANNLDTTVSKMATPMTPLVTQHGTFESLENNYEEVLRNLICVYMREVATFLIS
jgi:hypothetical protein